jgi:O-antigen/teichoic acid export membrane protein
MRLEVSIVVLARLFRLAAGVVIAIVTARFLGPAGRGEYFIVVTLAAVVAQFGNLGLHSSNTYYAVRDPKLVPSIIGNTVWVSLLSGGGLAAGVLAGAYLFDVFGGGANRSLWFVVVLAPLGLLLLLGENLLLGLGRTILFNAIEILSAALLVVLHVVSSVSLPTSAGFLAARTVAVLVSSGGALGLLLRISPSRFAFDGSVFRAGFGYAARAYLVALLGYLVLRTNVFLLQVHGGFEEVGLYSVASQVADAMEIVPTSVSLVLFPKLLHQADDGWMMMRRSLAQVAVVMLAVCLAVTVLSDTLVDVAFGPDFVRSSSMLRLLLPQVFLISLTSIVSQFIAAKGMPRAILAVWTAGLVIAILLGSLLIPAYGGEGAAAALSLAYAVIFVLIMTLAFMRRRTIGARSRTRAEVLE